MNSPMTATKSKRFTPRTDPTTFEVLRHRIWQINDEQGKTLLNMSGSQVATEANDFNVAIADAQGNLVVVGPYILNQLAPLTMLVQGAIQTLGDDVAEGDMYLCNDPWFGCVHQNDVCILAPFYWQGRLLAWTGSVIHEVDVGGMSPGSWCHAATETYQEAPRYRYLKIMRGGRIQREVLDTYLTNSRAPDLVELDTRAQIGSATATLARLQALFERYGEKTVLATMADMLDYSERLLRDKLETIPGGEWLGDCYNDHDGKVESNHRYSVRLRKDDGMLTFDFRATDPQIPAFINCPYSGLFAATYIGVLISLCGDVPWNSGIMRCVRIVSDEGALNNAKFPAPVSGSLESQWNSANAAFAALGKMLTCSTEQRSSAMAVWQGASMVYTIFGENQHGDGYAGWIICSSLGGAGARTFGDGHDTAGTAMSPCYSVINVESAEHLYPVLYLYRKRMPDSGGPGRWRGGVSAESAITPYGTKKITVRMTTSGTDHSHTSGLSGGYPGGGSLGRIARAGTGDAERRGGRLPHDWSEISTGNIEYLHSKAVFELLPGDVYSATPHGGGGYGDPLAREPELVRRDALDRCVSPDKARKMYGVVLVGPSLDIDVAATDKERSSMRLERLRGKRSERDIAVAAKGSADTSPEHGAIRRQQSWVCGSCGSDLGAIEENAKDACMIRERPVSAAGSLIAPLGNGDSKNLHLKEYACPNCASLLFVDQRLKSETERWHDVRPD